MLSLKKCIYFIWFFTEIRALELGRDGRFGTGRTTRSGLIGATTNCILKLNDVFCPVGHWRLKTAWKHVWGREAICELLGRPDKRLSYNISTRWYYSKVGVWVALNLSGKYKITRVLTVSQYHLAWRWTMLRSNDRFLHRVVTDDKSWYFYVSMKAKKRINNDKRCR